MRKVFFDTETTGLSPGQIGQLSVIILGDDGQPVGKNYFFKVDYMSDGAAAICNRDVDFYEQASNGEVFSDRASELVDVFKDATLIAHNLKFDENFLSTEFWRTGTSFKPADRFDTMAYFKDICKIPGKYGKYKNPKLEELVDYFGINKEKVLQYTKQLFGNGDDIGFHDARYDTTSMFVAFQVYGETLRGTSDWASVFCS